MKKNKHFKTKITTLALATTTLLTSSGAMLAVQQPHMAFADTVTSTNYSTGVISPVTVPNGNFNSNSGSSLSAYNWTMQGETSTNQGTSGAINTGNGFADRQENYYIRKNPGTKSSDNNVLMINSRTNETSASHTLKRGYSSSSISLEANSFYSFQVSMKNDTNYNTHTEYVDRESPINYSELGFTQEKPLYIAADVFNPKSDDKYTKPFSLEEDVYIKFDHPKNIKDTYLKKVLTENSAVERLDNVDIFYDDDKFVGFIYGGQQLFALKEYVQHTEKTEETEERNDIVAPDGETIKTYTLENFEYDKDNKSYIVADNSVVYTTKEVDDSLNNYSFGSFYLDGLKKDGKNYNLESNKQFERKSSATWTTFYYFIATGDEKQSINLSLWLGTRDLGSTGVVFFDDCKGYRYSENEFWKAYQNNQDKTFAGKPSASIIDLRSTTELVLPQLDKDGKDVNNFNFEQGLSKWETTGNARVFSTRTAGHFKNETGFDFVGSNLSCIVDFDGEKVDILQQQNNYVLAVWANNSYSRATTSQGIDIHANEIYKVTAQYKISELNGNAYMFIKECENSSVPKDEKIYKLADEQASSAITSNPDNDYINDYGTVEFFVKGGARYDTKFTIGLGVGKNGENATGCVLFDNIQITQATTEQYNAASNKVEFDAATGVTRDFTNGNFNAVNVKENQLPSAENWTVQADTTDKQIVFNGVINTGASQFASYKTKYTQLKEKGVKDDQNPYFFASFSANPKSPTSPNTEAEANNNIYMMGNYEASYQKLTSSELNLEANKDYKISFQIKRTANAKVKVSLVSAENENFVLYKSQNVQTQNWSPYEINIKSSEKGAIKVKLIIELGEAKKENFCTGFVYLDDFVLNGTDVTVDEHSKNLVDMTDYFNKLPTNNLSDNLLDSFYAPISGSSVSGEVFGNAINITSSELENDFKITKQDDTDDDFALLITSQGKGSYQFQTNYNFDLSADAYVVSFELKTKIKLVKEEEQAPENRGVSVWLDGYKKMSGLQSEKGYEEFKLYIKPSEAQSLKLNFAFDCDENVSLGAAVIYNFKVESADDYDTVDEEIKNNKNYDVNTERKFVTSTEEDTDTDNEETDTDTDTEKTSGNISDNAVWLLIPSLIMAAALIIAIVGYFLRKIKIKKIQTKHAESYDRKDSLNVDVIKQKASEERDGEVKKQQQLIDKYQAELDKMEEEHKKRVIALRENDKGKVSKETDKEFKHFAQKRTAMAEKIESLNRQLEELKSPEHLLSLERKLYIQEENKRREIERHSKKQNKEVAKQSKKKSKETKKDDKK